jgi:putative thiamine transport system permease protein
MAAAGAALVLVLAWLEATPPGWDRRAMPLVLAPLVVPPLLLMAGLYTLALSLRLDGTLTGLAWVHTLVALPYVFVTLAPAWRSFDRRYEWAALALGRSRAAFWWRVKVPLLAAPVAAALAVGFAVSVAQYLPTQFIGAGRHATVTTEAVTLASGGQRHTAAAFAVLQALLPAIGFGLAAWVGRRQATRMRPT